MSIHKATPPGSHPGERSVDDCAVCGETIRKVPGGHGPVWVHDSTGTVVGTDPKPMNDEAQAYAWVHEHMPVEEGLALAKFVERNPHMAGANWWDVLDMLLDADAHLDMIYAMSEIGDWSLLHRYVTYTLIYSSEHFATMQTPSMQAMTLRDTIANNDR